MKQRYLAVYEHRKDGYSGFAPDLLGCIAIGKTLKEIQRNMREAFEAHIAALKARSDEIPKTTMTIVHFPHPSEGHGIDHWVIEDLGISATAQVQTHRQESAER